jgi:formiminotetrahydrofolate cyclodeaminase
LNNQEPKYRNRLKAKIHEAGFRTQHEFCHVAGIDQATFSHIITGYRLPHPGMEAKIARTLKLSTDELRELY